MELDGDNEKDKAILDALLSSLLTGLLQFSDDVSDMATKSPLHEVELVVLRLLSVLMSRARSSNKSSSEVYHYYNALMCFCIGVNVVVVVQNLCFWICRL